MNRATRAALVDRLSGYARVVEIGVGDRFDVATTLADSGVHVTVTDLRSASPPEGITFIADDVTDPDVSVYEQAEALYALNLPPELHRPLVGIARTVDAACLFTTLGADRPTVPTRAESIPYDTVFTAEPEGPS